MKQTSWRSALIAPGLFVTCLLGFSNSARTPSSTSAAADNFSTNQTTAPAEIAGNYDVTGTNEDGSAYKGVLQIIKHGDAYQFRWNAGQQYGGVGGENGGVVAVAFTEGTNGKGCGVVTYKVPGDGTLEGKWGYWGLNEVGTEKATRVTGSGLEGTYDTTGKNPDGREYKGKLSIAQEAGGYKFVWNNDSAGLGIRHGDT